MTRTRVTKGPRDELAHLWAAKGQSDSVADAAVEALRAAILRGLVPAGTRLTEEDIANRFSVSRTPVREALMRLQTEKLVERDGRRGVVVARMSEEEILDVYLVRSVLDGLAARLAARSATDADLARLRSINGRLSSSAGPGSVETMAYLGLDFHEALGRASHSRILPGFIVQAHNRVRQYGGTTLTQPGRAHRAVAEHAEIIQAVTRRDEVGAEQLARDHMTESMKTRLEMLFSPSPSAER